MSTKQRAKSGKQRAKSREQRAEIKEQRAESGEQKTQSRKWGVGSRKQRVRLFKFLFLFLDLSGRDSESFFGVKDYQGIDAGTVQALFLTFLIRQHHFHISRITENMLINSLDIGVVEFIDRKVAVGFSKLYLQKVLIIFQKHMIAKAGSQVLFNSG